MTGTASQIEWASEIRPRVELEFERVASAFRTKASLQNETLRADTLAIIAILEEKRAEVLSNERAGYFIQNWQELTDQVRQLIAADGRYKAIRANRELRADQAV